MRAGSWRSRSAAMPTRIVRNLLLYDDCLGQPNIVGTAEAPYDSLRGDKLQNATPGGRSRLCAWVMS